MVRILSGPEDRDAAVAVDGGVPIRLTGKGWRERDGHGLRFHVVEDGSLASVPACCPLLRAEVPFESSQLTDMSSPILTKASESDRSAPVVQLDELNQDELRLVASFIDLVRAWRDQKKSHMNEFQMLWDRIMSKASDPMSNDEAMEIALAAQREVRLSRV
jgi:hypothetical protein